MDCHGGHRRHYNLRTAWNGEAMEDRNENVTYGSNENVSYGQNTQDTYTAYGQNMTNGQQSYNQQPPYNQSQYGQQPYNQPQYGQQPYNQQQYGQPPYNQQYGQPPYNRPVGAVVVRDTMSDKNNVGIVGFVIACFSILCCWIPGFNLVFSIIGIVTSAVGLGKNKETGRGLATAGLVLSIVALLLSLVMCVLIILV